jgi:acyl-CoA dehydrogenase
MMASPGRPKPALATRGAPARSASGVDAAAPHPPRRLPASAAVSDAELRPVLDAAAQHACDVDRDARFPTEALAALRDARLMSALVPASLGGRDASLKAVVSICEALARACASSAMMFAMHQAATFCLVSQDGTSPGRRALLERLAAEQLLLGTVGAGAAVRVGERPYALFDVDGERFTLTIDGATIPYGAYADGLLVALPPDAVLRDAQASYPMGDEDVDGDYRASGERTSGAPNAACLPDAPLGEGAFVALLRDQYDLDRRESWDALGMRGLCSDDFRVVAHGRAEQILRSQHGDFAGVGKQPVAQLLHSAVWIGIAADALERAQASFYARTGAHSVQGMPGAARLAEAHALLQMMRAHLASALEQATRARRAVPIWSASFAADMNALRTGVSKSALALVNHAMMVCGIDGYRNDTDVSVARHLRDLYAAPLAIDHDCIAANPARPTPEQVALNDIVPE